MTTREQYARLEELFLVARELGPDQRAGFLAQVSVSDPGVAPQLRQLLLHHDTDATGPLHLGEGARILADALDLPGDRPAGAPDAANSGPLPRRLGPYRLIRELGEGGMGVVYEAEQDEPKRRVALKVIRDGLATQQAVARFHREVQILGQLRHPGIAQIYDADTSASDGRPPYFVMELIDGSPLLKFAADHALNIRQRLELILSVCDALRHAHEHDLIHRDLKPGNILVEPVPLVPPQAVAGGSRAGDPCGRIRLIDFGVARSAALETLTIPQGLVGTVTYMSPEQVVGDELDVRSDVYSVGVITFELLTGRLPYPIGGQFISEAARIIREQEPSSMGSVDRALRGDIDVIIGKALAKRREDRYASAAELAADIRRYLDDQGIVARAPSAVSRLRRYTRRRRAPLLAGVLALAGVAMLTAGGLALYRYAGGAQPPLREIRFADEWLASNPHAEAYAFDQLYPGVAAGNACLAGESGPVTLQLSGGTVAVSAFRADGAPACAISDSSKEPRVSDAGLRAGGTVVMEFDPPITAFFAMFGSLELGKCIIVRVLDHQRLVGVVMTTPSTDTVAARGHGFVSSQSFNRIEFKASDSGPSVVGAFRYLVRGEPSLGTTTIPGPPGEPGELVQRDFACVFDRSDR